MRSRTAVRKDNMCVPPTPEGDIPNVSDMKRIDTGKEPCVPPVANAATCRTPSMGIFDNEDQVDEDTGRWRLVFETANSSEKLVGRVRA